MSDRDRGLDDEERQREFGNDLVARLHGLLRASRLYDPNNRSFQQQLDEFIAILTRGEEGEDVTLVCMGDCFYVDGVRLKARPAQLGLYRALREEFEGRALGALRFLPGLGREELIAYLKVHSAARTPEQSERIPEDTVEAGVVRLVAIRARDVRSVAPETAAAPEDNGERARARQIFGRAVRGVRSVMLRTSQTGRPATRQVRRLVQPIVDSILNDEYSIVGLTAIKEHDEYTFVHCVNVSVLSVAIGAALGLPRAALANLGVAALLHDLGKLAVPTEVLHKPGKLSAEEWEMIESHPMEGLKMLAGMPGLSPLMLVAMRVSLEHHMNVDGSGYPRTSGQSHMSVMSRIVAVADVFDALTAHRAYRARPFSGYEALAIMLGPERAHADPAALWAMVRGVGLYPAGTVMQTHSGHVVMSLSPNPEDLRRPFCRVIGRPGEASLDPASELRWDPMPDGEQVARVIPPEEHGLPIDDMLAA
jgi:HD-GYP domain-containing protein (c-di-GMP phosphodiesterase class II)